MSKDMPWKPTLSSASSSTSRISAVKGYISQRDFKNVPSALQRGVGADGEKQSWKQWAGEKISAGIRAGQGGGGGGSRDSERIALFPGWAARRHRLDEDGRAQDAFDIDIFVSGFASSHRPPELASRSQRAFMRLAKGFAALPKLDGSPPEPQVTRSTEELLSSIKLPPRPTEITEDFEVEALERQFQRINAGSQASIDDADADSIDDQEPPIVASSTLPPDVRRLHKNLETRIQPFWSSVLSSRTVRLQLFASALKRDDAARPRHNSAEEQDAVEHGPVTSRDVTTGIDGSFQARIRVSWEDMCHHPGALHIAFGDPAVEHELLVTAILLAPPFAPPRAAPETRTLHVTLTNCPVRVISDIDDTVKLADVLSGARVIFHNVFVKEYKDIVIPGMGEWYTGMWRRGVRFHYVSNGPFELLPVLADFFQVSQLPPGSIKLRSYAGRSLFSGLLSAPAARKRAGVQEILQSFPESRFFLIGDSGEQDLELYTEFARERPEQILGVFIRDVESESGDAIEDPTGWKAVGASSPLNGEQWPRRSWSVSTAASRPTTPAYNMPVDPHQEYFSATPLSAEPEPISEMSATPTPRPLTPASAAPGGRFPPLTPSGGRFPPAASLRSNVAASIRSSTSTGSAQRVSEAERKRGELQLRVWRARTQMPGHVPLRVFRNPGECVEAEEILGRELKKV
ncbi:hypothetical protein B0H17DRAFT_1059716 [Mycena rosella]|uniref:Phosphatidate phosphatase APP1 catalytic domain-containing protein n=1 Tax=Mycena rosella TaxID=1033263 RepID=A0AAD7GGB3_MYCRO|nr:hypothetical protein B0H17DRAFT_1059716 [Mycena rosella]